MSKRKIALTNKRQRAILTDMLPFEIPPTFSNKGFYRFIRENEIIIDGNQVSWICADDTLDSTIRLIFGAPANTQPETADIKEWEKRRNAEQSP